MCVFMVIFWGLEVVFIAQRFFFVVVVVVVGLLFIICYMDFLPLAT